MFLALLVIFLTVYFQWQMAVAALVALVHDIVITAGIYALVGFEVTPATVIGLLTILGYSLYDTVVVFDKVKENTSGVTGQSRYTYSELANLALNQTLIRSINTSIVALLPVAAILFVGAGPARCRDIEGPGARAVHRHRGGHLLVDLRRDAGVVPDQGARARDEGALARGSRSAVPPAGRFGDEWPRRPGRRNPGPESAPPPARWRPRWIVRTGRTGSPQRARAAQATDPVEAASLTRASTPTVAAVGQL